MGSNSCGFVVVVKRKEVVAAVLPMQEHWLPMSNLDLLLPPLDVGVFFCYKKSTDTTTTTTTTTTTMHAHKSSSSSMVSTLKEALAEALVSFYAFAGEVVENLLGEPELLCNNRGVDFVHAYADVELHELDLHHPDDSVHGKLVPFKSHGVISVQVTELKCGGLVVGCTFDHRVADAHSANMFLVAWAHIARTRNRIPTTPSFRRSLLNPRRPGHYHHSIDNMYVLISSLPLNHPKEAEPDEENGDDDDGHLLSRIYYIDAEEINRLQSEANGMNGDCGGKRRRSKLEAFTAFLWKLVASAGDDVSKRCKMGVVVNGRERLNNRSSRGHGDVNGDAADFSMQNYFGNVLSVPYGEETVGELKAMELSQVADSVHKCIAEATKEEHFLGLIDWVESHRPEKAIVKVYCKEDTDEAAVVVSSGQRFPVAQVDFGWGPPDFGSYHFPWGGQTGYVMPMPSTRRDGDWIVYMHLLKKHLDLVESKAPHVFKPLCPSYLNL
ncbi:hypothetical protein Vadar_015994 [Vaccinium darrowii]|uniref:Uncharacterized protein n=1 Tax=Vaccinium darrowii TaxID=229202 RepID=A0ACB7Y8L3_9ERIC|nr:hypothetical protein Vadar_015994 [Vaccinium darrowii]